MLGARDKADLRLSERPQTNGQVESENGVLLRGLKRRLEKAKGTWSEEVPKILWAYHTTPQSTTKEMPFSLVYGRRTPLGSKVSLWRNPTKEVFSPVDLGRLYVWLVLTS